MLRIATALILLASGNATARELAVHPESRAFYLVQEDWMTGTRTVRGTNAGVTGSIAWSDSAGRLAFPATILLDTAGFKTEIKARDKKVAGTILDGAAHPKIIFTLTSCDPPLAKPLPEKTLAKGTLEVHGTKKDLELPVTITPSADGKTLTVAGKTDAKFSDFGLAPPHVPLIAKVHEGLTLEISLVLDSPY